MEKIRETTLSIHLKSLDHNYHFLKNQLRPSTQIMGVVKAFAYGNDPVIIGKRLEQLGAAYLGVAYNKEGIVLRKAGIQLPILVFHPHPVHFEETIKYQLTPSIFSKLSLQKFVEAAEKSHQKDYPIHLKINTGLNRLGFDPEDLATLIDRLQDTDTVKVDGIFSHLAASEDENEQDFTQQQIQKFKAYSNQIIETLHYQPKLHLCNTSGILNYPEAHFDMVRTGIGLYGYGNDALFDKQLRPIASLKTIISQIHHIKAGDSVGYNRRFIARQDMKTATLAFGYADGMHRNYSNQQTSVYINNRPAQIIGDVCMDMIMIDITDIDCQEGDEVLIFGSEAHNAAEQAQSAGTISYELLATLSARVKRVFIE